MSLVEVKPIDVEKWHGKSRNESFQRPFVLRALVDRTTSAYSTGLTEAQQDRLGRLLRADLSNHYNPDELHPFWDNNAIACVKLENKTNIFDTSRPHDEIKVAILKSSKFVANSMSEYEQGLFPHARFVIIDKDTEEKKKVDKFALRKGIDKKLQTARREEKDNILRIFLNEDTRKLSNDVVDMKLDELVNTRELSEFEVLLSRDAEYIEAHALVLEAIQKNVLRKEGDSVYYYSDRLGFSLDECVRFLLSPDNRLTKNNILSQVEGVDKKVKRQSISSIKKEEDSKQEVKNEETTKKILQG